MGKHGRKWKKREPVYGIGHVEDDEVRYINGKMTPPYQVYKDMCKRCTEHRCKGQECYVGTTICKEWSSSFKTFRIWFEKNYKEGFHLEKDVLGNGRKVYSPETCRFVPRELNLMCVSNKKERNGLPTGVYLRHGKYSVMMMQHSKSKYFGSYETVEEAKEVYRTEKLKYCKSVADKHLKAGNIDREWYEAFLKYIETNM